VEVYRRQLILERANAAYDALRQMLIAVPVDVRARM
jgi:hypothetical protein